MSHYFRCFINPVCNPCNRKSMSGQNSVILLIVIINIEFGHSLVFRDCILWTHSQTYLKQYVAFNTI